MKEIWRPLTLEEVVDGYEISTFGRIKTKDTLEKPMTASHHSSNGYEYIPLVTKQALHVLTNKNIIKYYSIDDLVAKIFIPIPANLDNKNMRIKVNHIDGNTRNYNVDNLEWIEDVEEWRIIDDFPNYEVSNWGRVRNVSTGYVILGCYDRYHECGLKKDSDQSRQPTNVLVHRLVGKAFIPGYEKGKQINHINENKHDNYYKNLEWVTPRENLMFGEHNMKITITAGDAVRCIETGVIYPSVTYASKMTGLLPTSIRECCFGSRNHVGGFHWEWVNKKIQSQTNPKRDYVIQNQGKAVRCIETGKTYRSVGEASRDTKIGRYSISRACQGKRERAGKLHWEFVNE